MAAEGWDGDMWSVYAREGLRGQPAGAAGAAKTLTLCCPTCAQLGLQCIDSRHALELQLGRVELIWDPTRLGPGLVRGALGVVILPPSPQFIECGTSQLMRR